jgi:hypothetical protein
MSTRITTYDKVKQFRRDHMFIPWEQKRLTIGNCLIADLIVTLVRFKPFLLAAYDTFFLETERGLAFVTGISEQGLRIEYFGGKRRKRIGYEWLHFTNNAIRGDSNVRRRLVRQPYRKFSTENAI